MLLLLIRHAEAAERDEAQFPVDAERPLLPKGKRAQERVSRRLARLGYIPSVVFSSPWKRAWQTAGILARATGLGKKSRVACPALATDTSLAAIAEAIGPRTPEEIVALVGHEPWMSELASVLLTGSASRLAVQFGKSAVMAIDVDTIGPAAGRLRFFSGPRSP